MNNVIEKIVPSWVVTILKDWYLKKRSGSLRLDYSDGGIRNVHREDNVSPPKEKKKK